MKRKLFWVLVSALFGFGLSCTNYRLNHPPFSHNDLAFRTLAKRSDEIRVVCLGVLVATNNARMTKQLATIVSLRGPQIGVLEDNLRLLDSSVVESGNGAQYELHFYRRKQLLGAFSIKMSGRRVGLHNSSLHSASNLTPPLSAPFFGCSLHPRFEKRFTSYLRHLQTASYWQPTPGDQSLFPAR